MRRWKQAIAAYEKKIHLVYAANDAMGLGALQALQEAKLTNVMICSVDGQKEAYQEILKGGQYKSIDCKQFVGYYANCRASALQLSDQSMSPLKL